MSYTLGNVITDSYVGLSGKLKFIDPYKYRTDSVCATFSLSIWCTIMEY